MIADRPKAEIKMLFTKRGICLQKRKIEPCELIITGSVGGGYPDLRHELAFVRGHHGIVDGVRDAFSIGRDARAADGACFYLNLGRPSCL